MPDGPTARDLVRAVAAGAGLPEPSDDECDFILWERTPFPFGTMSQWLDKIEGVVKQMVEDGWLDAYETRRAGVS